MSQTNQHPVNDNDQHPSAPNDPSRRDFLTLTATAVGLVGVGAVALPFIKSMNPAADVLAEASIDVNLNTIPEGTSKVLMWRGKPIFIRNRTADEIKKAQNVPLMTLIDAETDQERFKQNPKWLVVIGVCTHLGCVPNERRGLQPGDSTGGWLCACHGSMYDSSGRVIHGPAPKNLEVPPYQFVAGGAVLRIG